MDLSEGENGFGDGELTDTENLDEEVANDLTNIAGSQASSGSCPGAAGDSNGVQEC